MCIFSCLGICISCNLVSHFFSLMFSFSTGPQSHRTPTRLFDFLRAFAIKHINPRHILLYNVASVQIVMICSTDTIAMILIICRMTESDTRTIPTISHFMFQCQNIINHFYRPFYRPFIAHDLHISPIMVKYIDQCLDNRSIPSHAQRTLHRCLTASSKISAISAIDL